MKLDRRQKATLWLGSIAVCGLCVYVPFTGGYSFIFLSANPHAKVDIARVALPVAAVCILTATSIVIDPIC